MGSIVEDQFFTIQFVAEKLCISVRTVRRHIEAGDLPAYKLGGLIRISATCLDQFLREHVSSPPHTELF